MSKNFAKAWDELKPKITFEYTTLPQDPDSNSLQEALKDSEQIESIILNKSESIWRNLIEEGFGVVFFPYKNVDIMARAWDHTTVCRIDLKSKKYKKICSDISEKYFTPKFLSNGDWRRDFFVVDVLKNLDHTQKTEIVLSTTKFSTDKVADVLGNGLDPKIKPLIEILNNLEIITTASCEGHLKHGLKYPWIDIDLQSLEKFLILLYRINDKEFEQYILTPLGEDFRFQTPYTYSLKEGQLAMIQLAKIIKSQYSR